MNLRFKVHPI